MKPLFFAIFPPLLLFSPLLGQVVNKQIHGDLMMSTPHVIKSEERANRSQEVKPELGLPWMLVYVPVRSCHRILKEKLGEFSPPTYNSFQLNIWCNWTIWAGSRKHIVIYIKGFMTDEDCAKNEDKILFQGVSSLVENTVIYACWNKKMHVFATYARAVNVVFLMKYSSKAQHKYFKGKYFIFKHRNTDLSSEDILVSQSSKRTADGTPRSNKVLVIYQGESSDDTHVGTSSSNENLNKNLEAIVTSDTGLLQVEGKGQNDTVLESSLQHVARTLLLKTEAHSMLEYLNSAITSTDKENSTNIRKSSGSLPQTTSSEMRTSVDEVLVDLNQVYMPKSHLGIFSEMSVLSVSPQIEPSKPIQLEGPKSKLPLVNFTSLSQTNMGAIQLNVNPTTLSDPVLASYSHSTAHEQTETKGDQNTDSTPSQSLSKLALVRDLLQSNTLAYKVMSSPGDRFVKGSLPSLRMPSKEEVALDQSQVQTKGVDKAGSYQTSSTQVVSGDKPVREPGVRTTTLKNMNPLNVSVMENSMEIADQLKVQLFTAAPYSMSEGEYHLRLQRSQHAELAATVLESVLPSSAVSLDLAAKKVNVLKVLSAGMAPTQQEGLVTEQEPLPSTEISFLPADPKLELHPSIEPSFSVLLSELDPATSFPYTTASLPPAALELGPVLLPSTEMSIPALPTEREPVNPFPRTEPSLPPAASELEPVPSLGTEVTFAQSVAELAPVIPSRAASLPQTGGTLKNELHLRTESSHFINTATELDWPHLSTTVLLQSTAPMEGLLEGGRHAKPHTDCYGTLGTTEHNQVLPSTTQALPFFAKTKRGDQQPMLTDVRGKNIYEAQPGKGGENFTPSFVTTNGLGTTGLQALKPEPELGTLKPEAHTRKLSPVTENLAKMPLFVTRLRVKQNELMFKNDPIPFSTKATFPLQHVETNTNANLTESRKETSHTTLKPVFPDTTQHPRTQETSEWSVASQSSAIGYSDGLTRSKKLALKENVDSPPSRASSGRAPENAPTSKMRVVLSHVEPQLPWLSVYFPVRSCHVTLKDDMGTFAPPEHSGIQTNIWCNWTIWAGPQKHILIYVKGFQGKEDCDENPDKIIFQGVLSSVERKVVYACKTQGTLIFATQALAVHIVFLSKDNSLNHKHRYFKGQYYVFNDYETTSQSTDDTAASQKTVQTTTMKKYGSIRFYPKSPIKYYKTQKTSVKTITANNENQLLNKLPMTDAGIQDENGTSTTLEALLRLILRNNTHIPLLKVEGNMTLSTHDLKWQQSIKSVGNETSSRKEQHSDFLITPALDVLRPNIQDKKEQTIAFGKLMHRPTIRPNLFFETLRFREPLKYMKKQSVEMTEAESLHRPVSMEDLQPEARPSVLRNSTPPHSLPSLQGVWEGQSIQTNSSQGFRVALIKDEEVPQSSHANYNGVASLPAASEEQSLSNTRLTGDDQEVTDQVEHVMNFERSIKESPIEPHVYRKGNNKGDLNLLPASALKNKLNVEPKGTPERAVKTESVQATVALHKILDASHAHQAETIATEFKPVPLSSSRSSPLVKAAPAPAHLGIPVTQATEPPWVVSTKLHPSPPSEVSDTSLETEREQDSFDLASIFTSLENDTLLESQHNPGDVLFEVTSEIEHQGWIPSSGNELREAVLESIKLHVQKNLKLLVSKVNEIKLKEIKRTNDLKPTFTFWLHLKPEKRNVSVLLHSHLKDLIGKSTGAEKLQVALLSVRDVNECNSGIGLCGDEADCLNEDGTYLCRCKKEYEDRSPTKSGTLCVRTPQSGIGSLFSYMEILVGTTVFFIFILVVAAGSLCTILKRRPTKKDLCIEEPVPSRTPSAQSQLPAQCIDLSNLGEHLTLDLFQPKLRAKPPAWTSQVQANPSETYRIFTEQSERL